jgi:hypothetical protein
MFIYIHIYVSIFGSLLVYIQNQPGTSDNTSVVICAFNQTENLSSPRHGMVSETSVCPIMRPQKSVKERKKSFINIKLG